MEPTKTAMTVTDGIKRKLKILWAIEVEVGETTDFDFWIRFVDQPHMAINLGHIPLLERIDISKGDRLILSLDLEPRNAQPVEPSIP